MEPQPSVAWVTKHLRLVKQGPRGNQIQYTDQLKHDSNKVTPSDTVLYAWVSALLIHHQRSFLLEQMGENTEVHSQPANTQIVRDLGTLRPKWVSPPNPSPRAQGTVE